MQKIEDESKGLPAVFRGSSEMRKQRNTQFVFNESINFLKNVSYTQDR